VIQRNLPPIIVGAALVIAATAVLPIAKATLRPIVRDLSKQMKYFLVTTKDGIEDIVAEVKFERMKKHLDQELLVDYDLFEEENNQSQILH
jgi:hypothetical protein